MMYVILTTIIATILTIYFSYNEYKKGSMDTRNFKIICVCEGVALIGLIYLLFT